MSIHRNPMVLVALALCVAVTVFADAKNVDEWNRPLYPSQQGAPAGYPGCFDDLKEDGSAKYPIWGHPELLNYPGSIEHFRHYSIKYIPPINPYNQTTLVRNWRVEELAGLATAEYAEPIYYVPMYNPPTFTGRFNAPVKVHHLKADGSTRIEVELGKLPRGMYVVRTIAAIDWPSRDWTGDPPALILSATLNDGPQGEVRTYTRRHRAVDQFYSVGEWYFHAVDDRVMRFTVALDPESAVDLLVHNVDLHNPLAGCEEKIIKTSATLYPAEARAAAQAHWAKTGTLSRDWGPNVSLPREKGLWSGEGRSEDTRLERDAVLWNINPPQTINHQLSGQYGKYDVAQPDPAVVEEYGTWELAFETRYSRNWDRPRELVNKKLDLTYTMEDYLAGKPLPGSYPYKDRGHGVFIEGKGYFHPLLSMMLADPDYQVTGHTEVGALCIEYFNRNNLEAAHDAAVLLCREAFTLPASPTRSKYRLQQVVARPAQVFGFNDPVHRRYTGHYGGGEVVRLARAYDMLFDFIKDNQTLAQSVGRFVPWIKTPDDLRAFLDQRVLAYAMQAAIDYRVVSSHGTPIAAVTLAIVAQDPVATTPLMDYLFTRTWDYPLPLSGIQDYIVTGTTRDGTTTIGSYFYTNQGSPLLPVIDMIDIYIRNGGNKKYNLADTKRYPNPFFGAYFNLDGRVAGMWPLGVGDVGGIMRYGHHLDGQAKAVRTGWKYLKDPTLAHIIATQLGRADETDAQWEELLKASATVTRNPWMASRSRVLVTWGGILESGTQHDDHRFRRAATVRVGHGWGHSHRDTLDLQIFALGLQMTPDGGQRPGYGRPDCIATLNHNLVEVDGDGGRNPGNWEGHAWIQTLADAEGSPMMHAKAIPPVDKQQVRLAERTVALVDVHEGKPTSRLPSDLTLKPGTKLDPDIVLPGSYVFDVYRVAGGKRHVYCFHGGAEDLFEVNTIDPRKVPRPKDSPNADDPDVRYLRSYVLDGYQGAGNAPEQVVATWRVGREPFEFETASSNIDEGKTKTYRAAAPEQLMSGANYDPASPRKFLRLHLLGQTGARLMWGRWVSAPYTGTNGQWFTSLHAMHDGEDDRESAFSAIIEPYAGEPSVVKVAPLTVADNEADALRAVAVQVDLRQGRQDVVFADGRPDRLRQVKLGKDAMAVRGRIALVARDADGLQVCRLVGGTELTVPGVIGIRTPEAAYEGTVRTIDQLNRTLDLDIPLPAKLLGKGFWEVGNDQHRTSMEVVKVQSPSDKTSRLHFRKGMELVHTRVMSVDEKEGVVVGRLVSILMGAEEDNGMKPGMTSGLWASNEDMSKWWSCEYIGGSRAEGYRYKLTGAPVTAKDFPVQGAIRIWEAGPTDRIRQEANVSLRRFDLDPSLAELQSNMAVELRLPAHAGRKVDATSNRIDWSPVEVSTAGGWDIIKLDSAALGDGTLILRGLW